VSALIAACAVRTCLGDGPRTFAALLRGASGVAPLRVGDQDQPAYADGPDDASRSGWLLGDCLREAAGQAGLDPSRQRVIVLVGTGLRELSTVEDWVLAGTRRSPEHLHFSGVAAAAVPGVVDAVTIANGSSAGGHVLALAQDLVELGEADAVIACGVDTMTRSVLATIGPATPEPALPAHPFDQPHGSLLLGEGAAAVVVVPDTWPGPALARLAGTGLSSDADDEKAPDSDGIGRCMLDAYERAGREPSTVDLVVAHGTGTALNDPAESTALHHVVVRAGGDPLVTAVKGSTGPTVGSAALINVDVAVRCMAQGIVPPVVGLRYTPADGPSLRFVTGTPVRTQAKLVQVNAFGFGGVNSVTLVAAL
jgi:3-oxoacyl-[acyl-carrier-protein] synthase II